MGGLRDKKPSVCLLNRCIPDKEATCMVYRMDEMMKNETKRRHSCLTLVNYSKRSVPMYRENFLKSFSKYRGKGKSQPCVLLLRMRVFF